MIYRFTEVLNDLVNYFLLGDILLLEDWKQANHLSDDLAMEFTTNESGDRIFAEGIVIPMTGIENYPYTILFNLSGDRPELCKERNRLQLRKSGYSLKVDHNMLMLFTWPILEQFTPEKVKDLISYYRVHKKPMIELANGWYHIEILGGETLQDGDYEPTFEFVIQPATNEEATINIPVELHRPRSVGGLPTEQCRQAEQQAADRRWAGRTVQNGCPLPDWNWIRHCWNCSQW